MSLGERIREAIRVLLNKSSFERFVRDSYAVYIETPPFNPDEDRELTAEEQATILRLGQELGVVEESGQS